MDHPTLLAILVAVALLLAVLASRASAEPIESIIRDRVAPTLPAELGIAKIYLPTQLATVDTDPTRVAIELPRALRAGRASIKVTVRGKSPAWVPVAVAALAEVAVAQRSLAAGELVDQADFAVERRAIADLAAAPPATLIGAQVTTAIAAGSPIAARDVTLPPPLARGTQVTIDVWRGSVHIRGAGTLELAARPGQPASARLAATKIVVHGRLVAPATVVVGESP